MSHSTFETLWHNCHGISFFLPLSHTGCFFISPPPPPHLPLFYLFYFIYFSVSASSHVSPSFIHTSQPISSPTTHQPHTQTSTPSTPHLSSVRALLVKVRVFESGETDFYEVEVPGPSYDSLLRSCAEELEVDISQIMKIRKLPNVLIRRDRDVLRLHEGQELEVVLKESLGSSIVVNPMTAPVTGSTIYGMAAPSNSILNIHLPDPSSLASVPTNSLGLHPTTHMNGLPWETSVHTNRQGAIISYALNWTWRTTKILTGLFCFHSILTILHYFFSIVINQFW